VWVVNSSNQIFQATPLLSVSPVPMSFTARGIYGHVPPWRQTLEIRNAGGGTLTWTVTVGAVGSGVSIHANEQCQNPFPPDPEFYYCSGGIKGTLDSTHARTLSGSGPAIVAVRVPGWGFPSGVTLTPTISISSNGGNASVSVTIVTAADVEFKCNNQVDDDGDGKVDSDDNIDCDPNPYAGF
jgi:hypothetical protein